MPKIYRIDMNKEVTEEIIKIAEREGIRTARVEAIGGLSSVTIAYFNHTAKKYEEHTYEEFMELTSLLGNITEKDGKVFLHAHVNLGRKDMTVLGGHLIKGRVFPFLEVVITQTENKAFRRYDERIGLNLLETG